MLSGAGEATGEVLIALPLPTMCTWAALAQQAFCLNLTRAAAPAVATLRAHFMIEKAPVETWVAHPMDIALLRRDSVAAASPPLLRAFALVMYTHACRQLERKDNPPSDRAVAVRDHVSRLVLVKLLLLGLQVRSAAPALSPRANQGKWTLHPHPHTAVQRGRTIACPDNDDRPHCASLSCIGL